MRFPSLSFIAIVAILCDPSLSVVNDIPPSRMKPAEKISVGGMEVRLASPPKGLVVRNDLGVLAPPYLEGQIVHRAPDLSNENRVYETRATITPRGDYLLMFPQGRHYGRQRVKVNEMLAYRSSDKGKTWHGPTVPYAADYNQHGFIPFIPKGSSRIYSFGTQPRWDTFSGAENAAIGFRYSDDDGRTWSDVRMINPVNDPGFMGMSVMRMCETDSGAWLLGSHNWLPMPDGSVAMNNKATGRRQYILRSEDHGKTWTVLPSSRPNGWFVPQTDRMHEGRPVSLGNGKILMLARTSEGHLWELRSNDDGKTWSIPKATVLVHPDAPPMLFHLSDGKTLIAIHHNRFDPKHADYDQSARAELWFSISSDQGLTWSEPRFLLANVLVGGNRNGNCSYVDMFTDGSDIHLFIPHCWYEVLHLKIKELDLGKFPTIAALR